MSRRWRIAFPWVVVLLLPLSDLTAGEETTRRLSADTALHSSAGGGTLYGLLRADTPVTELEIKDEWVKVAIEGWVHVSAVEGPEPPSPREAERPVPTRMEPPDGPPPSVVPATAPPSVPPHSAPSATVFPIEGMIKVKLGRMKQKVGADARVWLVPGRFQPAGEESLSTAEDTQRLAELDEEAARLKREADRALQDLSNFTAATEKRDELMKQHSKVLADRQDVLASLHGRLESAARQAALASAVGDSRGWFSFPAVSAGTYTLYARMIDDDLDLQWIEEVDVVAGTVKVDLDESTAQGLAR